VRRNLYAAFDGFDMVLSATSWWKQTKIYVRRHLLIDDAWEIEFSGWRT